MKPRKVFGKRVMNAIKGLYGDASDLEYLRKAEAKKAVKKPSMCPTEQQEQFVFAHWLKVKGIVHHHSPNGGRRDIIEAAKFKRLGTSAGFPDIIIPYPRKGYHGLFLELKRASGGILSTPQKDWRDHLIRQGYAWYEPKGAQEAIVIVEDYLKLPPWGV